MEVTLNRRFDLPHALTLVASVGVGLVFGGLTQLGQTYLPERLHSIANSGAPWVLIAFLVALLSRAAWVACVSGAGLASYLTVRDTTTPGYWVGQMLVGLVIAVVIGQRTRSPWVIAGFLLGVGALMATRYVPMVPF